MSAQITYSLQHSLTPNYAKAGTGLGASVAVEGGLTVAGAPSDDTGAVDSGVVKVFDSATGALLHVLVNPSPGEGDRFGFTVAISGTRAVVGAYNDNGNAGGVFVYDLGGATPTVPTAPVRTLNNPTPAADDYFGRSVAISGMRVVVGAPLDDTGTTNAGSVYVYDLSSATPTTPIRTFTNPNPAHPAPGSDGFGLNVAISGTRVIVAAPFDDAGARDAGVVYAYDLNSGTPTVPLGRSTTRDRRSLIASATRWRSRVCD